MMKSIDDWSDDHLLRDKSENENQDRFCLLQEGQMNHRYFNRTARE